MICMQVCNFAFPSLIFNFHKKKEKWTHFYSFFLALRRSCCETGEGRMTGRDEQRSGFTEKFHLIVSGSKFRDEFFCLVKWAPTANFLVFIHPHYIINREACS